MADKDLTAVKAVIEALEAVKAAVETKLTPSLYGNHAPRITNKINQELNQLRHLSGTASAGPDPVQFEPINSFFGEEINRQEMIPAEKIIPSETDKEAFLKKVNALYDILPMLDNEAVIRSYKAEPSVIRGVAKKVGLEYYKDAEINFPFLNDIRNARTAQLEKEEAAAIAAAAAITPAPVEPKAAPAPAAKTPAAVEKKTENNTKK